MRDRHDGRGCTRVPGIVFGAHANRIVTASLIIPSTRGFERNGDGVTPIRAEGDAAAGLDLSILVQNHICGAARIHPGATELIRHRPRYRDGHQSSVWRPQHCWIRGDGDHRRGDVLLRGGAIAAAGVEGWEAASAPDDHLGPRPYRRVADSRTRRCG